MSLVYSTAARQVPLLDSFPRMWKRLRVARGVCVAYFSLPGIFFPLYSSVHLQTDVSTCVFKRVMWTRCPSAQECVLGIWLKGGGSLGFGSSFSQPLLSPPKISHVAFLTILLSQSGFSRWLSERRISFLLLFSLSLHFPRSSESRFVSSRFCLWFKRVTSHG